MCLTSGGGSKFIKFMFQMELKERMFRFLSLFLATDPEAWMNLSELTSYWDTCNRKKFSQLVYIIFLILKYDRHYYFLVGEKATDLLVMISWLS